MIVRWLVAIEKGAVNPKFNSRAIFPAFGRISEYWGLTPQQVTSNPNVIFQLTSRSLGPSVAAYTSGIRIFIPPYPFVSFDQIVMVLTHELGHIFRPGNIHAADPRNVMFSQLNDVYKNFYLEDPNWYRLSWKTNRRPWQEPNRWRPVRGIAQGTEGIPEYASNDFQPCEVGHIEPSWYETIRNILIPRKQVWVYE